MKQNPEPIREREIYNQRQLEEALRLGPSGLREMKANGLKYVKQGRNHFYRGEDVLEYFDKLTT